MLAKKTYLIATFKHSIRIMRILVSCTIQIFQEVIGFWRRRRQRRRRRS
jgi:hypothetical protein